MDDRVVEFAFDPARKLQAPAPDEPAPGGSEPAKRAAAKRSAPARSGSPSPESSPSTPAAALAVLREFQLPAVPTPKPVPETLVQLDLPPTLDLHQQLRVPAFIMLSGVTKARPPTRRFLAPPERTNTAPVPSQVVLDLRPPILDVQPGRAKIPDVVKENPRLPAPVGSKAPVATFHEPVPAKHAATVTAELPAPPANIVSLPDRPIPLGSAIVLPPLNQIATRDSGFGGPGSQGAPGANARPNESGAGGNATVASNAIGGNGNKPESNGRGGGDNRAGRGAGSAAAGIGSGRGPESGSGTSGGTGSGSGNGRSGAGAVVAGNGSGSGASGAGGNGLGHASGPGTGDRGSGAGGGNGTGGGNGNAASASRTASARIVRPIDGNYEIAIVQSSGSIPGSSGLLNGRPVYSVYIQVGDGKEWILQYCLPPADPSRTARSQVVQLGTVTPLSAPYAFVIIRPNVRFRGGARYGFVHAFVNAEGRFDRMTEVGQPAIENIDVVLESLQQWEFRPAAKDGAPALVEVLLCIPNA
jgi:hypothetical protein